MMMLAGSEVGEEHGERQQAGRHQVLRPQLHRPHTKCSGCLFVFCILTFGNDDDDSQVQLGLACCRNYHHHCHHRHFLYDDQVQFGLHWSSLSSSLSLSSPSFSQ